MFKVFPPKKNQKGPRDEQPLPVSERSKPLPPNELHELRSQLVEVEKAAELRIRSLEQDKEDLRSKLAKAMEFIETLRTQRENLADSNKELKEENRRLKVSLKTFKEEAKKASCAPASRSGERSKKGNTATSVQSSNIPAAPSKGILLPNTRVGSQSLKKKVHFSEETEKEISRLETIQRLRKRIVGVQTIKKDADDAVAGRSKRVLSSSASRSPRLEQGRSKNNVSGNHGIKLSTKLNSDRISLASSKDDMSVGDVPSLVSTEQGSGSDGTLSEDERILGNHVPAENVQKNFVAASTLMIAASFMRRNGLRQTKS